MDQYGNKYYEDFTPLCTIHEIQIKLKDVGSNTMTISQWGAPMETWSLQSGMVGFLISTTKLRLLKVHHSTILSSRGPTIGTILILHSSCTLPEWRIQTKEHYSMHNTVETDIQKNGSQQPKDNDKA